MQPDTVTQFQEDIFGGRWDAALQLLPQLTFDSDVALQVRTRQHTSHSCRVYSCLHCLHDGLTP